MEENLPSLNVASVLEQHWGSGVKAPPDLLSEQTNDLGEHAPLSGGAVALSLIGLNLIREHNLLRVLDSLSVSGSVRQEGMRHWFAHWLEEWHTVADRVDFQIAHLPLTSHNIKPRLIVPKADSVSGREGSSGIIRSFLETIGTNTREALRVRKDRQVQEKFGTMADAASKQPVPILNSQVYWQGRILSERQYLFGMEEGSLRAVRLTSMPSEVHWARQFSDHIWLWISLMLLLPIFLLLSVRWVHLMELWLQFPHFWGMIAGVLLWAVLPKSFIGLTIIILTFMSLFRPSWSRHRSVSRLF
jgi:hypothetical protein